MIKPKCALSCLAVFIIAGSIISGIVIGKAIVEPQVITEQITIRTETIKYEQLPPEIVYRYFRVPIKIKVEVPVEPKAFMSIEELGIFLGAYTGNLELRARNYYLDTDFDCDDFAFKLRDYALEKGMDIETEGFNKGEYNGEEYLKEAHLMCKTFIGNETILIDPIKLKYWSWWKID